jgi:putative endonuclease
MTSFIYIIYSTTIDTYYVGYSQNPWVRLKQHNTNSKDKYTGRTSDWELAAVFSVQDEITAIRLERYIKKQKSRRLLSQLCQVDFIPWGELAQLVRVPHLRD